MRTRLPAASATRITTTSAGTIHPRMRRRPGAHPGGGGGPTIRSGMSTLLITLPAAAVVLAVAIGLALADHRQPAMLRDRHGRALDAPRDHRARSIGRS